MQAHLADSCADMPDLRLMPAGTPSPALEITDLEVRYDAFTLGPVSLRLAGRSVVGLLGPNGSGKSTLIRSVLGLQRMDAGAAALDGEALAGRPPELLHRLGYVPDSPDDVIPELTPWE